MGSVILSLIILSSYTIAVCWRWGVPNSISQTFFSIKHKWIFSACVAVGAGLLLSPLMAILPDMWQWLGFLAVAGALFVAFAPNLNDELERETHLGGAILLCLASQGIVLVLNPWMMLSWAVCLAFSSRENWVFWAEIAGGAALYAAVLI